MTETLGLPGEVIVFTLNAGEHVFSAEIYGVRVYVWRAPISLGAKWIIELHNTYEKCSRAQWYQDGMTRVEIRDADPLTMQAIVFNTINEFLEKRKS